MNPRPSYRMRMFRVCLILGSLALLLLFGYQNAGEFDAKNLDLPRHLASIHESQVRDESRRKSPELYLQQVWDQSPIAGQLGRQIRDEEAKADCNLSDPNECSEDQPKPVDEDGLRFGMDPMRQSASVHMGSGFETSMNSIGGTSPSIGIRKEFTPNSCINLEMNQHTNQGRLTFDLKF